MNDFYNILEVSPRARKEVIAAAHKALIRIYHPDIIGDDVIAKSIGEAYEVLKNKKSRAKYDKSLDTSNDITIGDYKVIRKIAEGGFGVTYEGKHIGLDTAFDQFREEYCA